MRLTLLSTAVAAVAVLVAGASPPGAQAQQLKQIQLTDKQVEGFVAAQAPAPQAAPAGRKVESQADPAATIPTPAKAAAATTGRSMRGN